MRDLPDVRALNDDLRDGEKRADRARIKAHRPTMKQYRWSLPKNRPKKKPPMKAVWSLPMDIQQNRVGLFQRQMRKNSSSSRMAVGISVRLKTISDAVMQQSGEKLEIGEIRLRVGNRSEGLIHAKAHEKQAQDAGYDSIENLIADVAENYDQIYMRAPVEAGQNPTYSLVKLGNKRKGVMDRVALIYFELQADGGGNYYIVVSAMPKGDKTLAKQTKKDRLIYSSPGLDAATESNAGAVSASARNVGADSRGGSPTSDKSSGLVTSTIPSDVSESKQKRASNANGEGDGSTNKSNKNEPSVSAGPVSSREALGTPPVDGSFTFNIPSEQEKSKEKSVQMKSGEVCPFDKARAGGAYGHARGGERGLSHRP